MSEAEQLSDRELDALVAERVMGLVRNGGDDIWSPHDSETGITLDVALPLPRFSTDIACAFQVVEVFRKGVRGHAAAVAQMTVYDWVSEPDCECKIYGPDIAEVKAFADSMPRAICLAALESIQE